MESHFSKLADRLAGVLLYGTSEQTWLSGWHERLSTEDHTGSDNTGCFYFVRVNLPEGAVSLEVRGKFLMYSRSSVFHVQVGLIRTGNFQFCYRSDLHTAHIYFFQ